VLVCDQAGNVLHVFTPPGAGTEFFGVAIGPDGKLYALGFQRVFALDASGNVTASFPAVDSSAIAVGPDGNVWVAGGRVTEYSPTGVQLAQFFSAGTNPGQFTNVSAFAIGPDGTIAIADNLSNRVETYRQIAGTGGGGGGSGGGGGGSGSGGGPGGGGGAGGGGVVNITPPALTVVSGPTAAQIRSGKPVLKLRCDQACTVGADGELKIIRVMVGQAKRFQKTGRATARTAAKQPGTSKTKKKQAGKPLPKLPPARSPTKSITSAVTASSDVAVSNASLAAGAATGITLRIPAGELSRVRAAAARGTRARLTLELSATNASGQAATQEVTLRVVL
jgi:hypothetical protein